MCLRVDQTDSNFTVTLAKGTTTAMSDAALSLNVSSGVKVSKTVPVWSKAGYSLIAELGNDGPADIEVSVSMVIASMQSGDGVLKFSGSYLCALYGDAVAPSTMPPITAPPPSGESCADYYVCTQCVETTLVKSRCQWCHAGDKGECRAPDAACVAPLLTPVMPFGTCPAMATTTMVGGCQPCVKMTRAMCAEGMVYTTGKCIYVYFIHQDRCVFVFVNMSQRVVDKFILFLFFLSPDVVCVRCCAYAGPPDVCGCDTVGECKALTRVIFNNAAPTSLLLATLVALTSIALLAL